jgi:hypothetical protein
MTITRSITATQFQNFLNAYDAPKGVFEDAKAIRDTIGYLADETLSKAQALGLNVCNSDGIFNLEIEIYGYLRRDNEDRFVGAEGYGETIGDADEATRERINAGLIRDREFLASVSR